MMKPSEDYYIGRASGAIESIRYAVQLINHSSTVLKRVDDARAMTPYCRQWLREEIALIHDALLALLDRARDREAEIIAFPREPAA